MTEFDLTTFAGAAAWVRHYSASTARLLPERDGYAWKTPAHFVAQVGRAMVPHPKPRGLAWGVPRYCYLNCHRLVARSRRYRYAEGLAVSPGVPFPFAHAWVVDTFTGLAHEITTRGEPPVAFVGVAFEQAYSRRRFREQLKGSGDCCGPLIDAWEERWPLLRLATDQFAGVIAPDPPPPPG